MMPHSRMLDEAVDIQTDPLPASGSGLLLNILISSPNNESWIHEYGMNGSMLVSKFEFGSSVLVAD